MDRKRLKAIKKHLITAAPPSLGNKARLGRNITPRSDRHQDCTFFDVQMIRRVLVAVPSFLAIAIVTSLPARAWQCDSVCQPLQTDCFLWKQLNFERCTRHDTYINDPQPTQEDLRRQREQQEILRRQREQQEILRRQREQEEQRQRRSQELNQSYMGPYGYGVGIENPLCQLRLGESFSNVATDFMMSVAANRNADGFLFNPQTRVGILLFGRFSVDCVSMNHPGWQTFARWGSWKR
jgi:hypothetical protein